MKNVVTIGGGTGSFTLLSGLKKYPLNISAIVSMADDGGSTGRLRDELGVLPPGDVRQCLVALSNSSKTLRNLMNYRFEKGELEGHNFGNLFLSALEKTEGGFLNGVEHISDILNIKGNVIPVSEEKMNLCIKLKNKKVLVGQKDLDQNKDVRKYGINKVYLKPKAKTHKKVLDAVKNADLIVIGPGDHYGSIIPNLLTDGISKAIQKSKAKVIYNCNLTNKKGQTENFSVDDYVDSINSYISEERINFVICSNKTPNKKLIDKYEKKEGKSSIVKFDKNDRKTRNYHVVLANVLKNSIAKKRKNDKIADTRSFIRHDSKKLAKVISFLLEMDDYESVVKEII